ncbi:unnamed protein product [Clonostachys byssicola]|uniref:Uncharacterized protein n=1 Tax=Clonostachys byssicola TaxID=160290 RepID=A0A9N9UPM2_9HYPO|nr:unnamed protein product [Clonostachys byssicola]
MVAIKNIAVAALAASLADQALAMPISGSAYETRDLEVRRPFDESSLAKFFIGYRKLFRASHGHHDNKKQAIKTPHTKAKAAHTETHAGEHHAEADKASASASTTPEPAPEPAAAEETPAEEAPAAEAASEELRDYQMEEFDERDVEERSYFEDLEEREYELDERDIEELLYARYLANMEESEEYY